MGVTCISSAEEIIAPVLFKSYSEEAKPPLKTLILVTSSGSCKGMPNRIFSHPVGSKISAPKSTKLP